MNHMDLAIRLAKKAGQIQMDEFGKINRVRFKGAAEIVTDIDKKCERMIVGEICKEFPGHDIVAEEGSGRRSKSEWRWIIDPLDGTINYAHGYPLFAVSIALEHKGDTVLGVVYEPNRNELFVAEKGGGAELNGRKISVSKVAALRKALLDTGFAYNVHEREKADNVVHFRNFLFEALAFRRDGAAAVDLCYVACGRFDGFWELYLKPWDIAAGQLIVKEAGGTVSSFDGSKLDVYGTEILASNGKLHRQMVKILCRKR